MPRGSKESYSPKQKRMASHIENAYEEKGSSTKRAERIAWATVNKETGGAKGKKSTSSKKSASSHKKRSTHH